MSPNAGEAGARPFDRVFPFRTTASEEDVLQPGWLAPQELTNAQVGETLIIYGTDYVLHARVTAKNGNQVILTRIGSEKGPDPLIVSVATIAPGEVHTSVTHGLGYVPRPGAISITPLECDVAFEVSNITDEAFEIDVLCASQSEMTFNVQVVP